MVLLMALSICSARPWQAIVQKDVSCCVVGLEVIYGADSAICKSDPRCCDTYPVCPPDMDLNKHKVQTPSGIVQFECHVDLPPYCPPPPNAITLSFADLSKLGVCVITKPDGNGTVIANGYQATVTPSGNINYKCDFKP